MLSIIVDKQNSLILYNIVLHVPCIVTSLLSPLATSRRVMGKGWHHHLTSVGSCQGLNILAAPSDDPCPETPLNYPYFPRAWHGQVAKSSQLFNSLHCSWFGAAGGHYENFKGGPSYWQNTSPPGLPQSWRQLARAKKRKVIKLLFCKSESLCCWHDTSFAIVVQGQGTFFSPKAYIPFGAGICLLSPIQTSKKHDQSSKTLKENEKHNSWGGWPGERESWRGNKTWKMSQAMIQQGFCKLKHRRDF